MKLFHPQTKTARIFEDTEPSIDIRTLPDKEIPRRYREARYVVWKRIELTSLPKSAVMLIEKLFADTIARAVTEFLKEYLKDVPSPQENELLLSPRLRITLLVDQETAKIIRKTLPVLCSSTPVVVHESKIQLEIQLKTVESVEKKAAESEKIIPFPASSKPPQPIVPSAASKISQINADRIRALTQKLGMIKK